MLTTSDGAKKKLRKNLKKVEKKLGGYRKRVYLCNIKNKQTLELMKTNIYVVVSREIEAIYEKYIALAYHYQRFPLLRDVTIDGEEEELQGYLQREGNDLVVVVENIGFEVLLEPMRFEFPVYDEDEDEDFED